MNKTSNKLTEVQFRSKYAIREEEISENQILLIGNDCYDSHYGTTSLWHAKTYSDRGYKIVSWGNVGPGIYRIVMEKTNIRMGEVGQDTGLVDRNGKRVLIGDLVEFDEKEWGNKCIFVVEYRKGRLSVPGTLADAEKWWTVISRGMK